MHLTNKITQNMKAIILSVLISIPFFGWTQKKSVVTLNNGSSLVGILQETDSNQVKIKIAGGSTFIYPKTEVKEVSNKHENASFSKFNFILQGTYSNGKTAYAYSPYYDYYSPYYYNTVGGAFNIAVQYQFHKNLAAGIFTGIENISYNDFIPFGAALEYSIFNKLFTPFVTLKGGYGWLSGGGTNEWADGYQRNVGGINLETTIGVKKEFLNGFGIALIGGYKGQRTLYESSYTWNDATSYSKTTTFLNRYIIGVQLRF